MQLLNNLAKNRFFDSILFCIALCIVLVFLLFDYTIVNLLDILLESIIRLFIYKNVI